MMMTWRDKREDRRWERVEAGAGAIAALFAQPIIARWVNIVSIRGTIDDDDVSLVVVARGGSPASSHVVEIQFQAQQNIDVSKPSYIWGK